ncbi:MAG TPA: amidohydrolase family protein [Bryobacteraceae bacterium]|jgi:predicted TIM-barrel fold metal-dependent hydrolase|nr:amidohydrolase family protein [Bryobacteraceae bacterium]
MTRPSPWGSLAVADAHLHFFSHHFFSILVSQKPGLTLEAAGAQLGWQLPPHEPEKLAAAWVHELDRHGVFASALIASIPGDEGSVIAAAHAFPDRFFAYAMVNPRALTAGLPATFSDVRVACLFPAMHGYSIQDDCARPVFEWAQTHRRAMFVHCGVLSVGVRKKLGLPSPFDMRFSNPVDLHAVALRYPEVPIIVPHFGAGYFREALMLADQCSNVYLDTSSSNQWMRYQAGHLTLREVFRHSLEVAGPKRLLFGTDSSFFPRGWQHAIFEDQARALYEIGTSEADARAIFSENLLRILAP